jgi:hypothetical protein
MGKNRETALPDMVRVIFMGASDSCVCGFMTALPVRWNGWRV